MLLPSATCLGHSQQRRPAMTGLGAREPGLGLAELGPKPGAMNRDRLVLRFRVSLRGTYCVQDKVVLQTLSMLAKDEAVFFFVSSTSDSGQQLRPPRSV